MKIEEFTLERQQSIWEGKVDYNLSESGVHPGSIRSLFSSNTIEMIENTELTYGYTEGSPELRKSIASIYDGAQPQNIQVFNGSSEANFISMMTLVEPGDEVICIVPNYMQIHGLAKALGGNVRKFELNEALNWKPDLSDLEDFISKDTKLITLCNPNNPTGSVMDKETVMNIGAIAKKADAWLLVDEVYRGSELNSDECPSFWDIPYEKKVINCGLSKAYGLPGLRVGWSISNKKFINDCWANHDYTSIAIGRLSDVIAAHVLAPENRLSILKRTRSSLNENLVIFQDWINNFDSHFHLVTPRAGAMAFVRYDWDINSTDLVDRIRNEASVMLVAGDWYDFDGYIRFGYGAKKKDLISALDRVSLILDSM